MNEKEINLLKLRLISLNKSYREGNSKVSDREYDNLVEILREANPEDDFFKKGVIEEATDRMEALPAPMHSLEKIKTAKDFRKWLQKMADAGCKKIVCTPKFDGISLIADEFLKKTWTRGDGVKGQASDFHYVNMNYGAPQMKLQFIYTWGEAIIKKKVFSDLKEKEIDFPYKNARNMVAGIFNSSEGYNNRFISNVDFVRYGSDVMEDKSEILYKLQTQFENSAPFMSFDIEDIIELNDEEIDIFFDEDLYNRFNAEYKIDGIVIEVDEYVVREKLGRLPNENPAYAIAVKKEEWCDVYQTTVIKIEKGIGKTGVLNPVIITEPVEMNGATVSRVTAYNAAYLIDQHICEGALIDVTRGGDVIPKHLKTIEYNESAYIDMVDDLVICPSCGSILKWNETLVDLVCINKDCKEKIIANLVYFFKTMGCEQFEEPTIRRLYKLGHKTIDAILESHISELQEMIGKSKGKVVYNQIEKVLQGVSLARYLTAINIFDGKIAETTCQKILDGLNGETVERLRDPNSYALTAESAVALKHECELISGIGGVLALTFVKGLKTYLSRGKDKRIVITYVQSPKKNYPEGALKKVCFTGFRSKELEQILPDKGYVICNSVAKDLHLLVVSDLNSSSSKVQKAKENGIKIISRKEFENIVK